MTIKIFSGLLTFLPLLISMPGDASTNSVEHFTAQQQEEIGQISATYLAQHPEYLVAAQETLRQMHAEQQKKGILKAALLSVDKLLHSPYSPYFGTDNASVVIVVFSDYESRGSSELAQILNTLVKKNTQIKVIVKEYPINLDRSPITGEAAIAALQVWQKKGGVGYLAYRDAVYGSGKTDGGLMPKTIENALAKNQLALLHSEKQSSVLRNAINENLQLGQQLGITNVPTLLVMRKQPDANTTIIFTRPPAIDEIERAVGIALYP